VEAPTLVISLKTKAGALDSKLTTRTYFPAQHAARFPRNAEIPSCASAAMEFMLMISLA
jgi:hypothetical protein